MRSNLAWHPISRLHMNKYTWHCCIRKTWVLAFHKMPNFDKVTTCGLRDNPNQAPRHAWKTSRELFWTRRNAIFRFLFINSNLNIEIWIADPRNFHKMCTRPSATGRKKPLVPTPPPRQTGGRGGWRPPYSRATRLPLLPASPKQSPVGKIFPPTRWQSRFDHPGSHKPLGGNLPKTRVYKSFSWGTRGGNWPPKFLTRMHNNTKNTSQSSNLKKSDATYR